MTEDGENERRLLIDFVAGKVDVEGLATIAPNCRCEAAAPVLGGHGRVRDEEVLRMFLVSRSDIDLNVAPERLKNLVRNRPFKAHSLKRAYKDGMSVYRMHHASPKEIEYAARILFDIAVKSSGEHGGVLGIIDFPAASVRYPQAGGTPMCVLDTPEDLEPSGVYLRPSHADVVNSQSGMSADQLSAARSLLYNQIVRVGQKINAEAVADCDLSPFLPARLRVST